MNDLAFFHQAHPTDELNAVLEAIINGKPIPSHSQYLFHNPIKDHFAQQMSDLILSVRYTRKGISSIRQFNNVLLRLIKDKAAIETLTGSGMAFGASQIAAEFFDLANILRQTNHKLSPEKASKMACIIVGMMALTITSFGLFSAPVIAAANALRGLTSAIKSLLRQYENKKKLHAIEQEMNAIQQTLTSHQLLMNLPFNEESLQQETQASCQRYLELKKEHHQLQKIVKSSLHQTTERVIQLANLLVLIGAVLTFIPVTTPAGMILLTIGAATKAVASANNLVAEFKTMKETYQERKTVSKELNQQDDSNRLDNSEHSF